MDAKTAPIAEPTNRNNNDHTKTQPMEQKHKMLNKSSTTENPIFCIFSLFNIKIEKNSRIFSFWV